MQPQKLLRLLGLAAVALLALGALGYAFRPASNDETATRLVQDDLLYTESAADSDVMAQIDRALGRPSSIDASAGGTRNSLAPLPPGIAESKTLPGAAATPAAPTASSLVRPDQTGSGPADPLALQTPDDRKIVQTASLKLQVREVGAGFEEVGRIATAAGGFVASSNFSFQGESQVASVTVRVPAGRYQDVLSDLRHLGDKVEVETSNASDVTEEFSDLSARLRTLEATETQLLGFLAQAKNVSEVLQVQDRLNTVRGQIEQVKGRIGLIEKLSDLATITVHLRPVVPASTTPSDGPNLGAAVDDAWQASLDFLGGIAEGVISVLVFGWWVPFVALPAYAIGARYLRTHPTTAAVD